MTSDPWVELGYAIRQARLDLGWTTRDLAREALGNDARNGYVGQVEKGKRNLSPETIDKFDQALDLPAEVVKAAQLAPPPSKENIEVEQRRGRDTDLLLQRVAKDETVPNVAEALLTTLAYEFADGNFTDLETSYTGLRKALEAAENIRKRGEMPPDNTGSQLNAVMKEVAALNELGNLDEADARLEAEEQRMFEAHKAEKERLDEQARQLLVQRLDQDRLRNDPTAAADRLIRDLIRQAPPGGVFKALRDLRFEWSRNGRTQGDPFELRVALVLANRLYQRARGGQKGAALRALSNARHDLGERQPGIEMLEKAEEAARAALTQTSKLKEPQNWGNSQSALGHVLLELGDRRKDVENLKAACAAYRKALGVRFNGRSSRNWSGDHSNLGNGLQKLGELTRDADVLREAVASHVSELSVLDPVDPPQKWATSQNNLALARRWLGEVGADIAELERAKQHYDDCLTVWTKDTAPFNWAIGQWNLGDLALARYALESDPALLDTAEGHVLAAREVFEIGSEYQTGRCDELLAKIAEARGGNSA